MLLKAAMMIIVTDLLLTDGASIPSLKPLVNTVVMESVQTHQQQVLVAHFVVALANRAKLILLREILQILLSKRV
jgi:hypothetical protein